MKISELFLYPDYEVVLDDLLQNDTVDIRIVTIMVNPQWPAGLEKEIEPSTRLQEGFELFKEILEKLDDRYHGTASLTLDPGVPAPIGLYLEAFISIQSSRGVLNRLRERVHEKS